MLQRLCRDKRADPTVEMALVTLFFLFPLFSGAADFLYLVAARYQLNGALAACDSFAWNDPGAATNISELAGVLATINQHSLPQVTFPDGKADATTSYTPALSTNGAAISVTYTLIAKVSTPVPLPFGFTRPMTLSATSTIQIQ